MDNKEQQIEEDLLETARRIVALGPICDSCLGRQFAMLSTGLTNAERGRSIKTVLSMQASVICDINLLKDLASSFQPARLKLDRKDEDEACCTVCMGAMCAEQLNTWAEKASHALEGWEYGSFLIGTKMDGLLAENEELLLSDGGSKHAEPFKSELNREVGKRLAAITEKNVDLKNPDIVVHLDLENHDIGLQVAGLFIRGRYRKLKRGIPQTRWPCRVCRGHGCAHCEGTGKMYAESVDELIRPLVMEATQAVDTVFHGAGREDIDARMLGTGRPFIVEAVKPKKRSIDLLKLQKDINCRNASKIEVLELKPATAQMVKHLKEAAFVKTYSVLVNISTEVTEEKLKSVLHDLVGLIDQRTPTRVSQRRSDKHRERRVYSADLIELTGNSAHIIIKGDSGLYIKELISGDGGRTNPSLADILEVKAEVAELDVLDVGGESDGTSSWNAKEDQG